MLSHPISHGRIHCVKPSLRSTAPISIRILYRCTLVSVLLVSTPGSSPAAPEQEAPRAVSIGRIVITGNERTRTEIIRRELLFDVGDTLDSALLEETERNLRGLLFLGDARISAAVRGDSAADLSIVVHDLYSRALSPLFAGETGELSYGLVALDYNFLGRGQVAQVELNHDPVTGNSVSVAHRLPRLAGSRLALASDATAATEGHDLALSVSHPYYSLSTRWSYGFSLASHESVRRLYSGQELAASYHSASEGGSAWIGHSRGRALKLRTSLGLSIQDRRFESSPGFAYAPDDRRRFVPSASITLWRPRYTQARNVRLLGRHEDLQMGSWLTVGTSLSHRSLGSDRNFPVFSGLLVPRFVIGQSTFGFAGLSVSSRFGSEGYENLITSSQLRTYHRVRDVHSIAVRLRFDTVDRPEDAAQFLLGLDRGLRGYAPRSFDGSRRLLFNLEARPTFTAHRDYVLAAAVFVDGGTAWTPSVSDPDLHLAAGIGARLGLPRVYSTPVIRADIARGRVWQLSTSVGQYF